MQLTLDPETSLAVEEFGRTFRFTPRNTLKHMVKTYMELTGEDLIREEKRQGTVVAPPTRGLTLVTN